VILATLSLCAGAEADVTVGQVAPPNPEPFCNEGPTDTIEAATTGGNAYAMPTAGVLTSWSTSAGPGAGQSLSLKVYRPVSGTTYSVVAHDGPRALIPSVVNTFLQEARRREKGAEERRLHARPGHQAERRDGEIGVGRLTESAERQEAR
jgi:hypothetical protein